MIMNGRDFKLYLDPGHGGKDPGAVGNGLKEKDLTLAIALEIERIILSEYENVEVMMSRREDTYLTLSERTKKANRWGADFYLSIHINAGGGTGWESYTYIGDYSTKCCTLVLQNLLHGSIMEELSFFNDRKPQQQDLHVCRETNMPALLTENGFIDSECDSIILKETEKLDLIARAHVLALAKVFVWNKKVQKD
jgi:N-acetylmuramoyl-L-alanine amidase